ncbi:hypothetical protein HZP67_00710 [Elizabethkingia anophelis]|nr:hypothetical protein [Elizabethkingia anophelis]MCT4146364.1 hypothetical protein [Elizabethkingia anophelis]
MKLSEVYRKAFEENCIELIINACSLAFTEKKFQTDWLENDFSELLKNYINNSQFKITCETEKKLPPKTDKLDKGYGDKLDRIDFYFSETWRSIERFECYMEAKRLKEKDSKLKRAYIDEGMGRYISEKYPLGCMLGYLIEGETDKTVIGINSLLTKDKRSTEILNLISHKLSKSYYESSHSDIGTLKHLIFNFTNLSN